MDCLRARRALFGEWDIEFVLWSLVTGCLLLRSWLENLKAILARVHLDPTSSTGKAWMHNPTGGWMESPDSREGWGIPESSRLASARDVGMED
eukprot:1698686-Karenia_brevis.AAC.1